MLGSHDAKLFELPAVRYKNALVHEPWEEMLAR